MKYLFVDVETTGTDKNKHGITQISGAIVIDNEVKECFDFKFKPFEGCEIDDKALEVTNIDKEELLNRTMTDNQAYTGFIKILNRYVNKYDKTDKFFIVGYNVTFDKDFIYSWFVRNGDNFLFSYIWGNHIDVMVVATTALIDKRKYMKDFKQGTVAKYLGFNVDEDKLHGALYDIFICIGIYCHLTKTEFKATETLLINEDESLIEQTLSTFSNPLVNENEKEIDIQMLTTFPIGKYKGKTIKEVVDTDRQYIFWFYNNIKGQTVISDALFNTLNIIPNDYPISR